MKYNELWIEVLTADRYTRKEAERAIDRGTLVIEDAGVNLEGFIDDWNSTAGDEDKITVEQAKNGELSYLYPVEYDGKTYYIAPVY